MNRKKAEEILSKHITLGLSQACQVIDAMLEFASLNRERVKEVLSEVEDMHPYKQSGNRESYGEYNMGWSDACDVLGNKILDLCEGEEQPTDEGKKKFHQNICNSCGEPMPNDCEKCNRMWQS